MDYDRDTVKTFGYNYGLIYVDAGKAVDTLSVPGRSSALL